MLVDCPKVEKGKEQEVSYCSVRRMVYADLAGGTRTALFSVPTQVEDADNKEYLCMIQIHHENED